MDIFKKIAEERGMVARIYSDFDAFPESVEAHFSLNKAIMLSAEAPLKRAERELLAFRTSEENGNIYCSTHHKIAFENFRKELDQSRISLLEELAVTLTKNPDQAMSLMSKFEASGFSASEWQHAVNIVAYFNYTNRLAFAMSMQLEAGFEKSCN